MKQLQLAAAIAATNASRKITETEKRQAKPQPQPKALESQQEAQAARNDPRTPKLSKRDTLTVTAAARLRRNKRVIGWLSITLLLACNLAILLDKVPLTYFLLGHNITQTSKQAGSPQPGP